MKLRDIPEILEFLPTSPDLDADINDLVINIVDPSTSTPYRFAILHWACKANHVPLVKKLIADRERYGLNINVLDSNNMNALNHTKNASIAQMLVEAGLDLTIPLSIRFPIQGPPVLGPAAFVYPYGPFLPLDLFVCSLAPIPTLPEPLNRRDSNPLGDFPESKQTNEVLATVYDRYFYEKNKTTKWAKALEESAVAPVAPFAIPLIAEYASLLTMITKRTTKHELLMLVSTLQAAHSECLFDKRLRDLCNSLGENGIEKLAALLNQPTPSARPEQNAHPAVLAFSNSSRSITTTTATSSQTTTATVTVTSNSSNSSSSSSSSSTNRNPKSSPTPKKIIDHPQRGRRDGTGRRS